MAEESETRNTRNAGEVDSIFIYIVRVCMYTFFLCLAGFALWVIFLPNSSLPLYERNPIRHANGALVGEWGDDCCQTYALFPDGQAIMRIENNSLWTFGSIVRLRVISPYYTKDPDGNVCRIVYTRARLSDPLKRSCEPVHFTEKISNIFIDGRKKFVEKAQQTKALYKTYQSFGLVE